MNEALKTVHISDHALVRFMQRVLGMDEVNLIRNYMKEVTNEAARAGATAVTKDGFKYIIADGAVITVTPANKKAGK